MCNCESTATGCQLVYRQERAGELAVEAKDGVEFRLLATWADLFACLPAVRRRLGTVGLLKAAAKIATPSRLLYVVRVRGDIVNWGWISISFCRHYPVGKKDVVIGPVRTAEEFRGRGLATWGLKQAINAMVRRGHRVFFIDTSDGNGAMRKAIARCGFGEPVSSYPRSG